MVNCEIGDTYGDGFGVDSAVFKLAELWRCGVARIGEEVETDLIELSDPCDSSVCANATNDGVAYPANNYPQGFCICVNGVPEVHACPSGAVFDPTTAICISSTTLQCDISKCANATSENTYPVAANNDSHGFCYCFSATEIEFFSCPDDALFDPDLGICDVNGAVTSTPESEGNCTCPGGYKEGQLVANPTNCRLYYVCSSGRLQEHDCGAGNSFDQVSLSCQPVDKKRTHTIGHMMRSKVLPEDDVRSFKIFKNFFKKLTQS
ncbi:uncharacterized protein LOC118740147 [Rhagoletis pomonella]|uniref:uncharacterized protein LOC118740147 n=1 Tax=Rhagoletis pomonella TaxID=28610 RepID=UPI00178545DB|nr:uncharacterized protein LOC118740147 [Rhagoletis pomonella]